MSDRRPQRHRAGVIVVIDGRIALIDRERPGRPPYTVVPGGGVEPGERSVEAAVREAAEELGLDVLPRTTEPTFRLTTASHVEEYFVADVVGGTFGEGTGPEVVAPSPQLGRFTPVLLRPEEAVHRPLLPPTLAEPLLRCLVLGAWPDGVVELRDPALVPPVRVRAGALVIDDAGEVLLHRANDRGPFYEIPGGGVEEGETPEVAVLRELEEEAGLHGEVVRPLATVWKDGRREHYFLVRPVGRSGRDVLDLEPFFEPVWLPVERLADLPAWPKRLVWRVAAWHASGRWPEHPIELVDTIDDLTPPCRW